MCVSPTTAARPAEHTPFWLLSFPHKKSDVELHMAPSERFRVLCCSVVTLGRELTQNVDNAMALYTPVIKQLRHCATDGKFAERLKDSRRSRAASTLAAPRAALLQEPLEEIERPDRAPGGEYLLCKDIGMIASSLNLFKLVYVIFQLSVYCNKDL